MSDFLGYANCPSCGEYVRLNVWRRGDCDIVSAQHPQDVFFEVALNPGDAYAYYPEFVRIMRECCAPVAA